VVRVRDGLVAALASLAVLLAALAAGPGAGPAGWVTGLGCGLGLALAAAAAARSQGVDTLGPADLVTVTRAALACGVAALVAESLTSSPTGAAAPVAGTFSHSTAVRALVTLAVVALVLDLVDGRMARWTGTASAFGARLDGEADAFLMLVLSVQVARTHGAWVLAMGAARYVFAVAGWVLPRMRASLPPRWWRKVVTAVAGTGLVFAAAGEGPVALSSTALVVGALLLAESFGRDVVWLWRPGVTATTTTTGSPGRPVASGTIGRSTP
jgi:phosphatidylglycerophosphate synthase